MLVFSSKRSFGLIFDISIKEQREQIRVLNSHIDQSKQSEFN